MKFDKFFETFGEFANEFELSDIPCWLISRVYELDSIKVVHNAGGVIEPYRELLSIISGSDTVKCYTPVFFSGFVDLFLEIVKKGVEVSIIVSDDVFSRIISDFPEELERDLSFDNVRLYVSRNRYKFAFVVTDTHLLISFYLKIGGIFDYTRNFVCRGDAVRWGNDLFEFVRGNSEPIEKLRLNEFLRRRFFTS